MRFRNFFIGFFLLTFPLFIFAQNSDKEAKEKERKKNALLEQILVDAPNLKLGENRALVYAKAGYQFWETDEKRARLLFQKAIGELINAQTLAEADKKHTAYQNDLLTGQTTRPQILNTIASRDAELALEYLFKTRPAAIIKALSIPAPANSKITNSSANHRYLAQNEFNLEQNFIRLAADQNPERAVKLLKESLKKGFSGETLNLLKKLHEKDSEAANELASEIVGKLIQSKFTAENQPDYQNINTVVSFLTEFIREKPPTEKAVKFDDSQMRNLADKLISFNLKQSGNYGYYNPYQIIPIAEKLAPAAVEQLKKLQRTGSRHGIYVEYDPEINKLLNNSETTAEQLLAEAKKIPVNSRRQIYQTASNKLAQQGDWSRATEVLTDNFSDDALEEAIRNLNWQYSHHLMNEGKFAEAERIIDEMPENTRQSSLINLATVIYQKNPEENKSYAVAVLEKTRALISEKPENSTEMGNLMQIIAAYSNIEPTEAFRLFDPLIPQMNELADAAVILNGFQGNSNIRQGEFLMTQGISYGYYGADFSVLRTLAKNDFDRAMNLIDTFTRREIRIALKLQLAESIMN
jgi:hypothetical protein